MKSEACLGLFLNAALNTFMNDPPDDDFQCGYLVALIEVADALNPPALDPQAVIDARRLLVRERAVAAYMENA